jgi:hypothetical protein
LSAIDCGTGNYTTVHLIHIDIRTAITRIICITAVIVIIVINIDNGIIINITVCISIDVVVQRISNSSDSRGWR